MATVFWDAEGVILEDTCPLVKPLTHIYTVKLLKPSRRISGEFNHTKMLLKLSFNVTMHDHIRKQLQKWDGIFLLTLCTAEILLPHISTCVEPLEMPFKARGLGVMRRLLKTLSSGCEYNIQISARTK
jgi:hypothetical protein